MKKSLWMVFMIGALYVAVGGVNGSFAQQRPIVGGYREIAKDAPGVQEAAEFAISKQAEKQEVSITLVSVEHAERQTVAGSNYRLCLRVKIDDETQDVKVVVYQNLKREYSLTSWAEEKCGDSKADGQ